jgi:protein gp37
MDPSWAIDIRNQCNHVGVPFFFKQRGGTNKKKAGRMLDGRNWDEMPPPESRTQVRSDRKRVLQVVG